MEPGFGLNAATGEYGDLMTQGISDPVSVTRSALQNAASIAGMFLTTEAVVPTSPSLRHCRSTCCKNGRNVLIP